jgi:purine-nucleoside phosphorylase
MPDPLSVATRLKRLSPLQPRLAIVLGSGFHQVLAEMEVDAKVSYDKLAGFPTMTVSGHAGQLLIGAFGRTPVLVMSGRAHYYEGHEMSRVTFGIRVLAEYGIRDLLLTNAAGAVNRKFRRGDFMVISDHINFMGVNPLRGDLREGQSRFVDLTHAYDPDLQVLLHQAAKKSRMKLWSGVYLAVCGPSYETPAEIRAFGRLGVDAVGMSTVPETIVARQCNIRVAGLACVTNLAAGRSRTVKTLSHKDVLETIERVKDSGGNLLKNFAKLYGPDRLGVRDKHQDP